MLPKLCRQNIILGFLKRLEIHSGHSGYIQSFLFPNDVNDCLCHSFLVKNTVDVGSARIVKMGSVCLLYTSDAADD